MKLRRNDTPGTALLALITCLVSSACAAVAHAEHFDLVIQGGRVMDPETGTDAVANVGIEGGRIAAITTDEITGNETIDAKRAGPSLQPRRS